MKVWVTSPPHPPQAPPSPSPSLHRPSTLSVACVHSTHIPKPAFEQVHEVSGALATANSRRLRTLEPCAARDRAKVDVAADIDNLTFVTLADKVRQPPRVHERARHAHANAAVLPWASAQAQCVHDYVKRADVNSARVWRMYVGFVIQTTRAPIMSASTSWALSTGSTLASAPSAARRGCVAAACDGALPAREGRGSEQTQTRRRHDRVGDRASPAHVFQVSP